MMVKEMEARCGDVAVRHVGAPPADGLARPGALLVSVDVCGEAAREWADGRRPYVECPLTFAGGIDALLDCAEDASLADAVLDALDAAAARGSA